jgi:uncharacterized protein YoxC
MIVIVVCINCAIALICVGVAWFLVKLKPNLASVTETLEIVEKQTHEVLYPAPKSILTGQEGLRRSRIGYQNIQPNVQRVYQVLSLFNRLLVTQSQPTKFWRFVQRKRPNRY